MSEHDDPIQIRDALSELREVTEMRVRARRRMDVERAALVALYEELDAEQLVLFEHV